MNEKKFLLSKDLKHHTKGVRCLCVIDVPYDVESPNRLISGGLDGNIIVWKSVSNVQSTVSTNDFVVERTIRAHQNYILCCSSARAIGNFFSGSTDKTACYLSCTGETLQVFHGHTGAVNSVCPIDDDTVATGSWDGTAKLWSLLSGTVLSVLSGHSYAVCICLIGEYIVTGSQDKQIRVWENGNLIRTLPESHMDAVRQISETDNGFLSCSNDGCVNIWTSSGVLVGTLTGHSSFVYDVINLKSDRNIAVSSSEDRSAIIWRLDTKSIQQKIIHPGTVWQSIQLPNGDIVTACEDGSIRIWTENLDRTASVEAREIFDQEVAEVEQNSVNPQSTVLDPRSLPPVSDLSRYSGKKIGATKLFSENGESVAYTWNGKTWDKIGVCLGAAKRKHYYPGCKFFPAGDYDYIFDVDIDPNKGFCKLPFSDGQNTNEVASAFCNSHDLPRAYIPQIIDFIHKNTSRNSNPQMSEKIQSCTSESVSIVEKGEKRHFPLLESIVFKPSNWGAIMNKISEFNDTFEDGEMYKLSNEEISQLAGLIDRLKQPTWLREEIRLKEKTIVFKQLPRWPAEKCFPVIDLWRNLAMHPECVCSQKNCNESEFFSFPLKLLKCCESEALSQCCYRLFANMFHLPTNREHILRRRAQVLELLPNHLNDSKPVRLAVATVLVNFAIVLSGDTDKEARFSVLHILLELMKKETVEGIYYRSIVAIGTVTSHSTCTKREVLELPDLIVTLERQCNYFSEFEHIVSATHQLQNLLK